MGLHKRKLRHSFFMKAMAFLLTKQRLYAKIYQAFYQLHTLAAAYLTILRQSEPACVSAARGNKADVCRLTKKNKNFFSDFCDSSAFRLECYL
jgi:hypothetical protein